MAGRLQAAAARGEPLPDGWLVTPGRPIGPAHVPAIRARQSSPLARARAVETVVDELVANPQAHLRPLEAVQGSLGQHA